MQFGQVPQLDKWILPHTEADLGPVRYSLPLEMGGDGLLVIIICFLDHMAGIFFSLNLIMLSWIIVHTMY